MRKISPRLKETINLLLGFIGTTVITCAGYLGWIVIYFSSLQIDLGASDYGKKELISDLAGSLMSYAVILAFIILTVAEIIAYIRVSRMKMN